MKLPIKIEEARGIKRDEPIMAKKRFDIIRKWGCYVLGEMVTIEIGGLETSGTLIFVHNVKPEDLVEL